MNPVVTDFVVQQQAGNLRQNVRDLPFQVYILQNPLGKRYIGIASDLDVRIAQHNNGLSKWTKGKGPWMLYWTSIPMSLSEARKIENKLKRQKGGIGLETLKSKFPSGS